MKINFGIRTLPFAALLALGLAGNAGGQTVLWDDVFGGTKPLVVEGDVGTGYTQFEFWNDATPAAVANVAEAGGVLSMPTDAIRDSNAGNNSVWIATDAVFPINSATVTTGAFTFTDIARVQTNTGQTGRFFVGFPEAPVKQVWIDGFGDILQAAADGNYLPGLWVVIHGRYDWASLGGQLTVGEGALVHVVGTGDVATVTILEQWTWDSSVFVFGDIAAAGGRPDRVSVDLVAPDLTIAMTSDATGYQVSFSSTGAGAVLPATVSGTWAAKGVSNNFGNVKAMAFAVGRSIQVKLDRMQVSTAGGGGEGEGEGEPVEQGNSILSNVYPPFIDEGTTVVLTGPVGTDYQWKKDGNAITGATERELIFSPVTLLDEGVYTVDYNDGTGVVPSDPFSLSVSPEGTVPLAGMLGLAALIGAVGVGGASYLRRRR